MPNHFEVAQVFARLIGKGIDWTSRDGMQRKIGLIDAMHHGAWKEAIEDQELNDALRHDLVILPTIHLKSADAMQ